MSDGGPKGRPSTIPVKYDIQWASSRRLVHVWWGSRGRPGTMHGVPGRSEMDVHFSSIWTDELCLIWYVHYTFIEQPFSTSTGPIQTFSRRPLGANRPTGKRNLYILLIYDNDLLPYYLLHQITYHIFSTCWLIEIFAHLIKILFYHFFLTIIILFKNCVSKSIDCIFHL